MEEWNSLSVLHVNTTEPHCTMMTVSMRCRLVEGSCLSSLSWVVPRLNASSCSLVFWEVSVDRRSLLWNRKSLETNVERDRWSRLAVSALQLSWWEISDLYGPVPRQLQLGYNFCSLQLADGGKLNKTKTDMSLFFFLLPSSLNDIDFSCFFVLCFGAKMPSM